MEDMCIVERLASASQKATIQSLQGKWFSFHDFSLIRTFFGTCMILGKQHVLNFISTFIISNYRHSSHSNVAHANWKMPDDSGCKLAYSSAPQKERYGDLSWSIISSSCPQVQRFFAYSRSGPVIKPHDIFRCIINDLMHFQQITNIFLTLSWGIARLSHLTIRLMEVIVGFSPLLVCRTNTTADVSVFTRVVMLQAPAQCTDLDNKFT